jgi:hypothetical protein
LPAASGLRGDVIIARIARPRMALPAGRLIARAAVPALLALEASFDVMFLARAPIALLGLGARP